MDALSQIGNNFVDIFLTIVKYLLYTLVVLSVLRWLTYRYLRILFFMPFIVVLIPLLSFFIPSFSFAYSLFLFGFLFVRYFGIQPTDRAIDLSEFQRRYGQTVSIIGNLIMIVGFVWGCYNILFA